MPSATEPEATPRAAFDALAPTYDQDFTTSRIAQTLRAKVQQRLAALTQPHDHALEFGCGTGEDALFLAQRGVHVLATDASEGMLMQARAKAGDQPNLEFAYLDIGNLPALISDSNHHNLSGTHVVSPLPEGEGSGVRGFSLVYANFGVLNCLNDWRPLAAWLSQRVKVGGYTAFGVMSPFCLWETAWHGAHGEMNIAFRRWRKKTPFHTADETIDIAYPTIRRLTRDFAPYFRRVRVFPLGVFLPASDAYGVVENRPRLHSRLMRLEKRFGDTAQLALFADHYWIEFVRRGES
jgi:SAM-dependent methyltransferase